MYIPKDKRPLLNVLRKIDKTYMKNKFHKSKKLQNTFKKRRAIALKLRKQRYNYYKKRGYV